MYVIAIAMRPKEIIGSSKGKPIGTCPTFFGDSLGPTVIPASARDIHRKHLLHGGTRQAGETSVEDRRSPGTCLKPANDRRDDSPSYPGKKLIYWSRLRAHLHPLTSLDHRYIMSALRRLSAAPVIEDNVGTSSGVVETMRQQLGDYDNVVAGARYATNAEHSMTLREGLRKYPKAIAWSMLLSTAM